MLNKNYWNDKRVCIAGGASFIASHTIEKLLELGVSHIGVVDDFSSGNIENIPDDSAISIEKVDLRHYHEALDTITDADVVIDFASVHGGRGFVGTNHEVAISDNLLINTNVLKAAVKNGIPQIAFSSSACAYDTRRQMDEKENLFIPESWDNHDASMFPDGMYGLSKAVHERVLRAYHNDGLIKASICRFFTVFGARMKENHFILASIAKSFIQQDPFIVWGTGEEVRNFTPVQNTVEGLLLSIQRGDGEIYNIGLEQRITINQALETIWKVMDWRPSKIEYHPEKPVGIRNRVADCTKAKNKLGWTPKVSFEQGIRDTVDWYISTHDAKEVAKELERKMTER